MNSHQNKMLGRSLSIERDEQGWPLESRRAPLPEQSLRSVTRRPLQLAELEVAATALHLPTSRRSLPARLWAALKAGARAALLSWRAG
jgi:hypothetical protein